MLSDIVKNQEIPEVISELQTMVGETSLFSDGALYILKNELEPKGLDAKKRKLLYSCKFSLPGSFTSQLQDRWRRSVPSRCVVGMVNDLVAWSCGRDSERFRDRCDRYFWTHMVPVITANFGDLADTLLNTINEAIINYAEYSFDRWSLRRRVHAHLFSTEENLAYAIIRPSGTRLRPFDPLTLRTRAPGSKQLRKRGWGHTLLMERALFISFDHAPRRRGMLVVIGPKNAAASQPLKS